MRQIRSYPPVQRRVPKFGFVNIFKKEIQIINVGNLESLKEKKKVTIEDLAKAGLIKKSASPVKVLGKGEIDFMLDISVNAASKSAVEKIKKAGGTVTLI